MRNKVFGRKASSQEPMVILLEGLGVSTGGKRVEPKAIADIRSPRKAARLESIGGAADVKLDIWPPLLSQWPRL